MKKICIALLLALLLTGCKSVHEIRPDTIVDIPLDPTPSAPETVTEVTEPMTEAPTRPPAPEIPTGIPEQPTEGATVPVPQSYDPGGYVPSGLDRAVAEAVNAARQEAGLAPLTLDPRLCAIASVRAWEHGVYRTSVRPGGSAGTTVLDEYGYGYTSAAENLYFGAASAEDVARWWLQGRQTKERLLAESSRIGVGSYTAPDGLTYVAALIVG